MSVFAASTHVRSLLLNLGRQRPIYRNFQNLKLKSHGLPAQYKCPSSSSSFNQSLVPFQRTLATSAVHHAQTEGDNDYQEPQRRGKTPQNFQRRLHKRVFTKEDQADNKSFRQGRDVSSSDSDVFGTLKTTEKRQTHSFQSTSFDPEFKTSDEGRHRKKTDRQSSFTNDFRGGNKFFSHPHDGQKQKFQKANFEGDRKSDRQSSFTNDFRGGNEFVRRPHDGQKQKFQKANFEGDRKSDRQSSFTNDFREGSEFVSRPHDGQKQNFQPANFQSDRRFNKWTDKFGTLEQDELAQRAEESLTTTVGSHEERLSDDEDADSENRIRLASTNRRHIPEWYGRRILKHGKRGEVREALTVFEDWMLKQDRVMPNSYVFTCLLTVLGRAGYTHKAFKFFNQMKKMGIEPKPATYTALFNCCSNSPWKDEGRQRADNLYQLMKEKEVEPTFITGKAMVKAFAVCGDMRQAFALVDQLCQKFCPDCELFSFLLMACISDREAGMRYAVQVWQLMRRLGVQPDLPLYNLLIRCVRDCGVGDNAEFQTLLTSGPANVDAQLATGRNATKMIDSKAAKMVDSNAANRVENLSVRTDKKRMKKSKLTEEDFQSHELQNSTNDRKVMDVQLGSSGNERAVATNNMNENSEKEFYDFLSGKSVEVREDKDGETVDVDGDKSVNVETLSLQRNSSGMPITSNTTTSLTTTGPPSIPDILSPSYNPSAIVALGDLSTRENRLALLGGVDGMLGRMERDGARPDIVSFCQLISVAPPTREGEEAVLARMSSFKVKPDIDLINTLIHKRCMRRDFASAKEAGELVKSYSLTPNQRTFGVLAMTCKRQDEAMQLLADMEKSDMAPNMEILGSFMQAAGMKFGYRVWVLRQAQQLDLHPNAKFLHHCETGLAWAKRNIVDAEEKGAQDNFYASVQFQEGVERFERQYESWLTRTKVQRPPHPWAAFKPVASDRKNTAVSSNNKNAATA